MTGARLTDQLIAHGLDRADALGKAELHDRAAAALSSVSAAAPAYASWVPGRLEVFGKHTDYAGGRTLVAALPRGFVFLASRRTDGELHAIDARTGEHLRIADKTGTISGWGRYVHVVASRLARNFPGSGDGATIAFASDLPAAAGMSSSSALVVGVASALASLWNLKSRAGWRRDVGSAADTATYYASIESGGSFGELIGDAGVGTHGGSEDHTAMLLGKPGVVSAFSFVPTRHLADARLPESWRFVIATSGVRSEKTGSARAVYNRLSEGAAALLRLWNELGGHHTSLGAALASSPAASSRLREALRESSSPGWTADALARRLDHFIAEDGLAIEALQAFQHADSKRLGAMSELSQRHAEDLLGNQIEETIALARLADECGALAASSFGAGFGGSVWAITERADAPRFSDRWLRRYRERYPLHAGATTFEAAPGPGLIEVETLER